jgi:hypothetical protein
MHGSGLKAGAAVEEIRQSIEVLNDAGCIDITGFADGADGGNRRFI